MVANNILLASVIKCYVITLLFVSYCTNTLNTEFKITSILDKFAVSTSTVCAIHCLSLPLLLGVFPAISSSFFGAEAFHELLLWAVIPMTVVSLYLGCRKHKSLTTAVLGVVGLQVLIFTAVMGHDGLTESAERILTLIGATIIAIAHLRNYTLCRRIACEC